jgi:hypothetical protein
VNENLEIPSLEAEKAGIDEDQFLDLGDPAVPANESIEVSTSGNGFKGTHISVPHDTEAVKSTNHKKPIQFHGLSDATVPTSENLEMSDLGSEIADFEESQLHDLDDSAVPASENQEIPGSDSEKAAIVIDETQNQFHDPEDVARPANENLEAPDLEVEKAGLDEVPMHHLSDSIVPASENPEPSPLDIGANARENETNDQQKKKRKRRAGRKEPKNEGVPVAASDVPVEQTHE